jgi:predicted nucleic acid-binding protein
MRVVSDTSPISNLAIIGHLDLLNRRYGAVRIPPPPSHRNYRH